jgi:hypothetical protein
MRGGWILSGLVLSSCVLFWTATGDQTHRIGRHLAIYAMAFGAYAIALRCARDLGSRGLQVALVLAVVWRAALVTAPPLVSDDIYRYLWEGRIQLHGGNPYAWSDRPEAEKWTGLRDAAWAAMNHRGYTAIYPPLWQLAAAGVVAVSDSVIAMKAFLVGCEVLTWVALAALLRLRGLPRQRLLVWAWNPLALVEIAGSGHNEAFGLLFLTAALAGLEAGWPLASAAAAALGFQAKLLPGVIAAAWVRRYRPWHIVVAAALAALLVVPYRAAGDGLWRSLRAYGVFWRFNDTLFTPLAAALGQEAAARVAPALVGLVALVLGWRRTEPVRAGLAVAAAALLLAANVLPWYALWLLPFLVLLDAPPLLLFTATVALAYTVYPAWLAGEKWTVGWGVRGLEYGPCVLLACGAYRRVISRSFGRTRHSRHEEHT